MIDAADRQKSTLIVAYTHGQPAQPTTFGHYLAAAIEILIRDMERFAEARKIVDLSPMGAAAITTSGFPIDRARVAHLLGFSAPLRNSYSCIASVDYTTSTYSAIELMFLHLGRLIQDFQFWTSFEVGQIYVPNALVQISSIMPQKRNPVPIEHLRHLASQTFGRARTVLDVMHNTPFTDMNDSEGETQGMGYEAFASHRSGAGGPEHPPLLHHHHRACRLAGAARRPVLPRGARDRGSDRKERRRRQGQPDG
jgi:argininosuccinate lyase